MTKTPETKHTIRSKAGLVTTLSLAVLAIGFQASDSYAATLPASTAVPVVFTHSLQAGKVKSGDSVTAKTMQIITLPDGHAFPKGSTLVGHIVASRPFAFDDTPYASQQPSTISVHFDKIIDKGETATANFSVRALANHNDSVEAKYPHHTDETDSQGTMVQIGGTEYSPFAKAVLSSDGNAIEYNRSHGVYARLIANSATSQRAAFHCDATSTEQSVSIFSPDACGLYGFDTVYMPENGSAGNGTFTLASNRHSVKLYAGSTALLQVLPQ